MPHETDSDLGITPADIMTDEQRELSRVRQEAYENSQVGEWNRKNGTLLFDIDPDLIEIEGLKERGQQDKVEPKESYHVTILGYKAGKEILKALKKQPPEKQEEIEKEIAETAQDLGQGWQARKEVLRVHKDYPPDPGRPEDRGEQRTSYIQMADFPKVADFYTRINEILDLHLEPPPTHITLMTGSTKPENMHEGIGIPDKETLEKLRPEAISPIESN